MVAGSIIVALCVGNLYGEVYGWATLGTIWLVYGTISSIGRWIKR